MQNKLANTFLDTFKPIIRPIKINKLKMIEISNLYF